MELILKRISDLPEQTAADLTGDELTIVGNNGVLQLVPISAIYANAQSQLDNVANLSVVTLADIQDQNFTDTYITYPLLSQAIQSLGLLLTPSQQQAFLQHLVNYSNPHRVTAEQVGLGNVSNFPVLTESDLEANNFGNKYVTYNILQAAAESLGFNDLNNVANYPPTTLADIQNGIFGQTYLTYNLLSQAVQSLNIVLPPLLRTEFLAHLTDYDNPHEVTANQVGLGNVVNLPVLTSDNIAAGDTSLEAYVTYNLLASAINSLPNTGMLSATQKAEFLAHLTNYDNPHEVTAAQIGLGNVANLLPIAESDIEAVNGGSSPDDVYITYNMLYAANKSLGFLEGSGGGISVSIADSSITSDSVSVSALITATSTLTLGGSIVSFNYKLATDTAWSVFSTVNFATGTLTYTDVVTGLSVDTVYNLQVIINNPNNSAINYASNILQITTLSDVSNTGYSFDIIGAGSSTTTEFDSTTVDGTGGSFSGNTYVAAATGNSAISTISDPSGDGNFTSCSAEISFSPSAFITPQSGSTATNVVLSESDYNTLSSGEVLGVIVNGSIVNATIGTDCQLAYTAATTTTVPGTTTTVPGATQTVQPNIFLSSSIITSTGYNYYSGANAAGSAVGSTIGATGTGDSNGNCYTGLNGTGTITGSIVSVTNGRNFYSGANGTGTLLASQDETSSTSTSWSYNLYSPISGQLLVTSGNDTAWNYTDSEGNSLGSATRNYTTEITNYYSGANETGSYGIYVNQFFMPFPIVTTGPSTTVTSPSTTVTTAASYALTFNSGVLSAAPTSIFNNTSRQPVGCIGNPGSTQLAPLTVTSETYSSGGITLTLSPFTGNGTVIQLGLQNMIAGDTLVELKGTVLD